MSDSIVVIIGAGVSGLSTAYHLAQRRAGRIIVLEKQTIGDGSSSRAAAIITGHLWSETGVKVRKLALRRFRELSQELPGYEFHPIGCLNLFDPASWRDRQPLLEMYRRLEAPFEVLQPEEIQNRWPALTIPRDSVGLHDPLGGYSEPDEYLPALARGCSDLGVEIRQRQKVAGVLRRSGRTCGARTADGDIEADVVVCCSFAWTNLLLADAGIRLPVKSFVHQRYTTGALPQPVNLPAINANPLGGYVRPAQGNRYLIGVETTQREEWRVDRIDFRMSALTADPGLPRELHERFSSMLPSLRTVRFERQHIGLITFSMDYEPLIGPVKAIPGLYVACGFHSGGFAYNPATGMLLAECITSGTASIDISAYSPDRFDPSRANEYISTTVTQAEMAKLRH